MSEHVGYVVKVEKLRPHTNADRLQVATFFGNDTCVGLDVKIGDIGVYFPTDLQLDYDFCVQNHLLRKLVDGTPDKGYMDPNKRNVSTIKLRGEKSDGIYVNISDFDYCFDDDASKYLKIGDTISVVNGHPICQKYIPHSNKRTGHPTDGNRTRKKKAPIAPLFTEHADTEQLAYNLGAFQAGDQIEITLKMHGTSQRTGYLPVFKGYKRSLWDKIMKRDGTPIYEWGYVSGTRRTVLENFDGGFYGSNLFREQHSKFFEGKLHKGEEVYYEVVGFTDTGAPIMASASNKKLNDKAFIKQYGETTTFSYGCSPTGYNTYPDGSHEEVPQSELYVYRMTMTNEDGDIVEYTPDFMRYRCEQMGCKTVPVMWKGFIPADETLEESYDCNGEWGNWKTIRKGSPGEWIMNIAEQYYAGPDPIGKTHTREGVVIRIVNKPKFCAYKHKNFELKCLEGLVKAEAEVPDMEEAQDEV